MKSLEKYLESETQEVNESLILAGIVCYSMIAFAVAPLFKGWFSGNNSSGNNSSGNNEKRKNKKDDNNDSEGGLFSWFTDLFKSKKDKEEDDSKESNNKNLSESYNKLLMIAKSSNEKEKDKNQKQKNESMLKLLTACSFDKDGNEIPLDQRLEKMKDSLPEGTNLDDWEKEMTEQYNKIKDDPKFKESLQKSAESIKKEDYDKFIEESKKEAKTTLEQLEKEKKEIDDKESKLKK